MSGDHYFSQEPAGDFKPKDITISLANQKVQVQTAGGTFSPDHLDTGTAVLLEHLDQAADTGNILDIGCGWGPIAIALALSNPNAKIWAIDVNERSLELTKRNCERLGISNVYVGRPEDVPTDIRFSSIWSNPPIRVGKDALHQILSLWLPRLQSECDAYLVVAKNLGADSLLTWLQEQFESMHSERIDTAKGFRILRVSNLAD